MIATNYTNINDISVTPVSNTGLDSQLGGLSGIAAHLDYVVLCGVGYVADMTDRLLSCFGVHFDEVGTRPGVRGRSYANIITSSLGIEIGHDDYERFGERTAIRVSIPGKPLGDCGAERLREFLRDCYALGYHATRFDWAIDDFERELNLPSIADACDRGDFSGAREHRYYQRKTVGDFATGRTIYLGSASSDKQVRIYDKAVESNGRIDSIRYEVQWRGKIAEFVFSQYVSQSSASESAQKISNFAVGAVAFLDRSDKNLSRCDTLPWWRDFCARVGSCTKVSVPQVQPTLSSKLRWVEEQVSTTLCQIIQCKGMKWFDRWLNEVIAKGYQKLTSVHAAFVRTFKDRIRVYGESYEDVLNRLQSLEVVIHRDLEERTKWQGVSTIAPTHQTQESSIASKLTNQTHQAPSQPEVAPCCQLELRMHLPSPLD